MTIKPLAEYDDFSFAAACFNQNSIEELVEALLREYADMTDCREWGITPKEWKNSIASALIAKITLKTEE